MGGSIMNQDAEGTIRRRLSILIRRSFLVLILCGVLCPGAMANGVGWGPPEILLHYEVLVVFFEGLVIFLVFKPGVFNSLKISFIANLVSWLAGIVVQGAGIIIFGMIFGFQFNSTIEIRMIFWTVGVEVLLLVFNILIEGYIIYRRVPSVSRNKFVRTVALMNLFTWAGGMFLFSLMVKHG